MPPSPFHKLSVNGTVFNVDSKYQLIRSVGSGAYGVVISALDETCNRRVAIKKCPNAFNDEIDAKRILREIKLLKTFKHENIIGILDMVTPTVDCAPCRDMEDFKDIYIITELMETDLHRIIYSKQGLSIDHVQYFLYQILRGLKYMHSANVLHRDLKPSNLLVNGNCDLKICDLGLARGILAEDQSHCPDGYTEYVVTRWYRAPEIMLTNQHYDKAIDIWSVGCIFAELLGRKPLFPGEDYIHQLKMIVERCGKPTDAELDQFVPSDKAKRFIQRLPDKGRASWSTIYPNAPPTAVDLLDKLLQLVPSRRIDVESALAHPFFASLSNPADEPRSERLFDFTFEDEVLDRPRLQELVWQEIGDFRPECLPVPGRRRSGSGAFRK